MHDLFGRTDCISGQVHFNANAGRCGVCGDNWADARPRAHELGGQFGQGTVVQSYAAGARITVTVQLTANHRGHFGFRLCDLTGSGGGRETDACFERHVLRMADDGATEYVLPSTRPGWYAVEVQLPDGLRCEHCVLQWTYVAGNNWGRCVTGGGRLGCGPQEHFRACSDIRIF